jgi:hypothetical protein
MIDAIVRGASAKLLRRRERDARRERREHSDVLGSTALRGI